MAKRLEDRLIVKGKRSGVHHADCPLKVDDERGPLVKLVVVVPDPVEAPDLAFRIKIAEETERQPEVFGPPTIRLHFVGADPDDLVAKGIVLGLVFPKPGKFQLSPSGERLHVKRKNDVLLPDQVMELSALPVLILE